MLAYFVTFKLLVFPRGHGGLLVPPPLIVDYDNYEKDITWILALMLWLQLLILWSVVGIHKGISTCCYNCRHRKKIAKAEEAGHGKGKKSCICWGCGCSYNEKDQVSAEFCSIFKGIYNGPFDSDFANLGVNTSAIGIGLTLLVNSALAMSVRSADNGVSLQFLQVQATWNLLGEVVVCIGSIIMSISLVISGELCGKDINSNDDVLDDDELDAENGYGYGYGKYTMPYAYAAVGHSSEATTHYK